MTPSIIVSGLGRCGTSLVMQMLDSGGVLTTGQWPAYECAETMGDTATHHAWLRSIEGRAAKLLDPHRCSPPRDLPALVIWLDRDVDQQAQSQIKFTEMLCGVSRPSRMRRRQLASLLTTERCAALAALDGPDRRRLMLRFEHLVEAPYEAAQMIAGFLKLQAEVQMDAARAAAVAIPRSGRCFPGLLELEILERGRAA